MNNTQGILFVDDEEQTRKMFEKLVSRYFTVYTAENVSEAKNILETSAEHIGVLITDQRMPGGLGVELLQYVKEEYPDIIRLLTTAYSDLGDAIDAVNTGEIFRYITKPWHADELLIDLKLAMSFFELERDKSQLIEEKLNVHNKQHIMAIIRNLLALEKMHPQFANIPHAMLSLLSQVQLHTLYPKIELDMNNFWDSEISLCQNIGDLLQKIGWLLVHYDGNSDVISENMSNNQSFWSQLKQNNSTNSDTNSGLLMSLCTELFDVDSTTMNTDESVIHIQSTGEQHILHPETHYMGIIANLAGLFVICYHHNYSVHIEYNQGMMSSLELRKISEGALRNLSGDKWMEDIFILQN